MFREFTQKFAYIVWIGTEAQTANRTLVLATPTAFAVTNDHNGLQAHFSGTHDGSVCLPVPNEKWPAPLSDKSSRGSPKKIGDDEKKRAPEGTLSIAGISVI